MQKLHILIKLTNSEGRYHVGITAIRSQLSLSGEVSQIHKYSTTPA
jgi:hypothetical protein